MLDQPRVGQIVSATAGRDRGRIYLVLRIADGKHVELVDGVSRPVDKPKRKNVKHLQLEGMVDSEMQVLLASKAPVKNSQIRAMLNGIRSSMDSEGDD